MKAKYFFLFATTLLTFSLNAQETTASNSIQSTSIKKIYVDLSVGVWFIDNAGINYHGGIGYQINSLMGFGINYSVAGHGNLGISHDFKGVGLEYRLDHNKIVAKLGFGYVIDSYYGEDYEVSFSPTKRNEFYTRVSVGYAPKNKSFHFGLVYYGANTEFDVYTPYYDPSSGDYIEEMLVDTKIFKMKTPQIFIALDLSKIK